VGTAPGNIGQNVRPGGRHSPDGSAATGNKGQQGLLKLGCWGGCIRNHQQTKALKDTKERQEGNYQGEGPEECSSLGITMVHEAVVTQAHAESHGLLPSLAVPLQ
jgi:hypothetical protein